MTPVNANRLAFLLLLLVGSAEALGANLPPLTTDGGAVASDNAIASEAGAEILRRGGNAVDAAVTTALALGVTNPSSSGIGGGGFAVVYLAAEKKLFALDFRETAPAGLSPANFVVDGKLNPKLSRSGGLAVGVPGEVAGLQELWKRAGSLKWPALIAKPLHLARVGFVVSWFVARAAAAAVSRGSLAATWLSPRGKALVEGQRVRRSGLAWTLQNISDRGADGFYKGAVAKEMVDHARKHGGVLTLEDLAGYKVVEREPLVGSFQGYRIATMPLPSSGGLLMLEMLGILDAGGFPLAEYGSGSSAAYHLVVEILKHGFADRARYLGDDPNARGLVDRILEPARLKALAKRIKENGIGAHESYGSSELGQASAVKKDSGTSHFCVIDRQGNAVALTTTVNGYFGSGVVAGKSGVVLNNQIDDFSLASGVPNMFGLVQSDQNLVRAGRRPLSSMTPTLVLDDSGVVGCAGGSGGPLIISNTFQAILNVLVHKLNVREAVSIPRVHHQWLPKKLRVEKDIPADVVKGLRDRGHTVEVFHYASAVQAIFKVDGRWQAASDPRKAGAPAAE
jgi:gamma-glutamyltranspeptidase/glutathione hydrolase